MAENAHPYGIIDAGHLLFAADIAGTLVFAVEGAMAAVNGNLDLIGIMTLAFSTALGGGIIRDTLLGALPPASLRDWRYPAIVFAAAALVFFLHGYVRAVPLSAIQVLDAAGLAIFAVAGTEKAMLYKMNPLVAVLLGTVTGVGGGIIRDVLLTQVPTVLRLEVYATAALVGSTCIRCQKDARLSEFGRCFGRSRLLPAARNQHLEALEPAAGLGTVTRAAATQPATLLTTIRTFLKYGLTVQQNCLS